GGLMVCVPSTERSSGARDIFRLGVEGERGSGQPVRSQSVAGTGGVNSSPASIRAVSQELQDAGSSAARHTSAGRMPTEIGSRSFVDGIMQVAEPSAAERAQIQRGLAEGGTIEAALNAASSASSESSAGAGVVMVPRREPRLMQLSFMALSPGRASAVSVGEDGAIENRSIDSPADVPPHALEQAGNYSTHKS
ncbi:hypothetical protein OY671_009783, partial [Metschnikowia pulcherrima]